MGKDYEKDINEKVDDVIKNIEDLRKYTQNKLEESYRINNVKEKQILSQLNLCRIEISLKDEDYIRIIYRVSIGEKAPEGIFPNKNYLIVKIDETDEAFNRVKGIVDMVYELDLPIHELNKEKVKINEGIMRSVYDFMERIGVYTHYYDYKTSRSRNKSKIYYQWPSEIRSQIDTDYRSDKLDKLRDNVLNEAKTKIDKVQERLKSERVKKEKEKNKKIEERHKIRLIDKYKIGIESEWYDILEVILNKDKYLYLAYSLERNRGDWNEGCRYAESGLCNFEVESDLDKKIYADIREYIDNWGDYMDGRVFRDCEYNYSVLYELVEDKGLMDDFNLVREYYDFMSTANYPKG